jgi:hypothetical protein
LVLLGLLLAFTFSGAGARFDGRRHLIVEETNAIGTAYLRRDMLPAGAQPALRENFRRYVDARLHVYRKLLDMAAAKEALAKANNLQTGIGHQAVASVRAENVPIQAAVVVLPALNGESARSFAAIFEGSRAGPSFERPVKGADVGVAQQEGHLGECVLAIF